MFGEQAAATKQQDSYPTGSNTGIESVSAAEKTNGGEKRKWESENQDNGKRRRQGHRPDPFHHAKVRQKEAISDSFFLFKSQLCLP